MEAFGLRRWAFGAGLPQSEGLRPNAEGPQRLFRFPVRRVMPAQAAELLQLQPIRVVPLVLRGRVVPLFAVRTRHPDDQPIFLRHDTASGAGRRSVKWSLPWDSNP